MQETKRKKGERLAVVDLNRGLGGTLTHTLNSEEHKKMKIEIKLSTNEEEEQSSLSVLLSI